MNNNSIIIIVKLNKDIYFTQTQIETLFNLPLLNMEPRDSVSLVSSILQFKNLNENGVYFWLADTLSVIVKNIQRTSISDSQRTVVICWIIHFMSLVIDEKLSKTKSFGYFRECIKLGLANANEFMMPFPNQTKCPKLNHNTILVTNTAIQLSIFILNTIREMFWDDFKYIVIQLSFNIERNQTEKSEKSTKNIESLYQNHDTEEENCWCSTIILDRYFLRELTTIPLQNDCSLNFFI